MYMRPKDCWYGMEEYRWYKTPWVTGRCFDSNYDDGRYTDLCREQYPSEPLKWVAEESDHLHKESYHWRCKAWNNFAEDYHSYMGYHKDTRRSL